MNRLLHELQEADNLIAKLTRERAKLDDGTAARSERDTLRRAVEAEQERLQSLNATRADKELQLKSAEEKLARQQSRLMNAKSAHEVNSLQRDIAGLNHARGDLDEAILTLMDEGESSAGRLAELEKELAGSNARTAEVESEFAAQVARLDEEMAAVKSRRGAIAAQLDEESLDKYTSFARRFHGVAVAHPEKGYCSACGSALTPFNVREAKGQEWPICETCGRLLFVE